ncbi:hypothetical protein ACOYXV_05565 [Aeromonas veronii]
MVLSVDEGVLTLVQTVTDSDGDRASASVDLAPTTCSVGKAVSATAWL